MAGATSLHQSVSDDLMRRIQRREWGPGDVLPPEIDLAREYGVSVGTARRAMDSLVAQSLLVRRRRIGTMVATHSKRYTPFRFYRLMLEDGVRANLETSYVSVKRRRATEAQAGALRIDDAAPVWSILRVRGSGGAPQILERIGIPARLTPRLDEHIAASAPESLYASLEAVYGILVVQVAEAVTPVLACAEEAALIGIEQGAPMLEVERVSHDIDGLAVEHRTMRARQGVRYVNSLT